MKLTQYRYFLEVAKKLDIISQGFKANPGLKLANDFSVVSCS